MFWSLTIISLIGNHVAGHQVLKCGTLRDKYSLCNTEYFTPNGTTSMSSQYAYLTSEKAVDGGETTCAHTLEEPNSWWTIDLLDVYKISAIAIKNTIHLNTDITGAQILIGNSRENSYTTNSLCKNIKKFIEGAWNYFKCNTNMLGRYITVFSKEKQFVVLCEVMISGTKQESPFVLIRENKTWEYALDFCRNRNMDLADILDEEDQAFAELEAKRADTPFVWLALFYSCTMKHWLWVTDHRFEFQHWAPGNERGECYWSGAMDTKEDHRWYSKAHNETFNFICTKSCTQCSVFVD